MKKLPPVLTIATGLVMLTCAIILMGDFFFAYLADRDDQERQTRRRVADTIAVPVVEMLNIGEVDRIGVLLDRIVAQDRDIQSAAIRRNDGQVLTATRNHLANWPTVKQFPQSHAVVPIDTHLGNWGHIEVAFATPKTGLVAYFSRHPAIAVSLSIIVLGLMSFSLYMRRVLQQFDPNAVIPERVRAAFDAMTEGVVIVDDRGRIALANDQFRQMGGRAQRDLAAQSLSRISWLKNRLPESGRDHPWVRSMREQRKIVGEELPFDDTVEHSDRIVVNCAPISDGQHKVRGCMVTFDDLSELHLANQKLEQTLKELKVSRREVEEKATDLARLASIDYLTGALNRRAFADQAGRAFDVSRQQRHQFACLMIDIDHFKVVNDTFGHSVGDLVITAVADILIANAKNDDMVGRYGGEEFCIVLPNTGLTDALELAENIREAIVHEVVGAVPALAGKTVTSSVGVAVFERHHETLEMLIESADQALYDAKAGGRNRVCVASSTKSVLA